MGMRMWREEKVGFLADISLFSVQIAGLQYSNKI